MGEKTHYLISDYFNALTNGDDIDLDQIKLNMGYEMRNEFELSKNKDFSVLNFEEF
jgi:hypothetical protein